jgi:hypothetical protein
MSTFKGLYVDDVRDLPDDLAAAGWTLARSAWEALVKLELIEFEEVSLDHDLASFVGNKELTGDDILLWLVQRKLDGLYVPEKIYVHSANVVAVPKMQDTIDRYWGC